MHTDISFRPPPSSAANYLHTLIHALIQVLTRTFTHSRTHAPLTQSLTATVPVPDHHSIQSKARMQTLSSTLQSKET